MKKLNRIVFVGLFFVALTSRAQELIPMGSWRSHFNYQRATLVEQTETKIFAASSHGLMYYDQEDQSINKLSKIDGLSDVSVTALAYNKDERFLALGYQSGNVDVITADGITNLPVLKNSNVTEDKGVNHIDFYNGNMNLSTDFGLLVLTVDNQVTEAYQNLGEQGEVIEVRNSAILEDVLYLATEEGVLAGSLTNGDNLQDFNNWERFLSSVVYGVDIISVSTNSDMVYAASENFLFRRSGDQWTDLTLTLHSGEKIVSLKKGVNKLLILTDQRMLTMDTSENVVELVTPSEAIINDAIQQTNEVFWYADEVKGLAKLGNDGTSEFLVLDGPLNEITRLKEQNGNIYGMPALDADYSSAVSNGLGYSVFKSGQWSTYDPEDLNGVSNVSDVLATADQEWVASFGSGILNPLNNSTTNFTNSPLQENEVGTGNTLVSGLALDAMENIWVAHFDTHSLHQWNGEEEWQSFEFGSSAATQPTSLAINSTNQVWMTLGLSSGFGVLAYDIELDLSRYISATATSLPSNQINDIAFGKEGEVWFATDKGLAYFPFSFGVVEDQTIDVTLPIFDDRVLFEDKEVLSLAIDGGNRIWVGTREGLWLFEENITQLIEHFTSENSPLPSNQVMDLALQPESGELFVVTDQGIVSYRTNSSEGLDHHEQVQIFPNPVLPNFNGWVGLSGLANDAGVKITTISGQIVREINAAGGTASWNLMDYTGKKVSTGVYLVFSADRDGKETFVGKIAVVD